MLQVHWTVSSPLQDIEYQHLEGIPFDLNANFQTIHYSGLYQIPKLFQTAYLSISYSGQCKM